MAFDDRMVDISCYVILAEPRIVFVDVPDLGETYRQRLNPEMVSVLDDFIHHVQGKASQDVDPAGVRQREIKKFYDGVAGFLTFEERQSFLVKFERELHGPQFAAEKEKLNGSLNYLAMCIASPRLDIPAGAEDHIVKGFLERLESRLSLEVLSNGENQQVVDQLIEKMLRVTDALRDIRKEEGDGSLLWRTSRELWAKVEKRTKEKVRWQQRKAEEKKDQRKDIEEISFTVRFSDEEAILARVALGRKYEEIANEIQGDFRSQRAKNYLRLLRLLYEEGELLQSKETAKRADVSLRTLQNFIAEARRRGWIKE
jgi:hypothetical protein